MTDRVKGLVITLDSDIRIDDVQPLIDAISMLKGVSDVSANITDIDDHMNRTKISTEYKNKFYKFIRDELN